VAVKIPISLDPAVGKSFIRELMNWTKLDHTNIVKVYDYNILPIPYFEMELCDCSLADIPKPMAVEDAAWIMFNVAEGLKHAHRQGVVHRDLKPQNIMIKEGIPKVSDWGLSRIVGGSTSSAASFTPLYAAPEQISNKFGDRNDPKVDVWQLGVVFYELVTGRPPFEGEDVVEIGMAICTQQPTPPSEINPEAKEVEDVITGCLEKYQRDRCTLEEFQRRLADYLGVKYSESLMSRDVRRSAYYCGELVVVNMKVGDIVNAYKYASDLLNYANGEVRSIVKELCEGLKERIEAGIGIEEELIKKAEVICHKVRLGFSRV